MKRDLPLAWHTFHRGASPEQNGEGIQRPHMDGDPALWKGATSYESSQSCPSAPRSETALLHPLVAKQ